MFRMSAFQRKRTFELLGVKQLNLPNLDYIQKEETLVKYLSFTPKKINISPYKCRDVRTFLLGYYQQIWSIQGLIINLLGIKRRERTGSKY